ncbi:substrate-binding domain-containing protein [Spirochaeta africana]|uniref:ABC-type xylose transport system, periplasmic component n=1 Tax=Spirochaeta africana (strain ATCC 700263 / DSM 8902 / Z-7692) TaxID=889378 RepID=H9UFT8_SPIAZ|nr:substrate-binding domain-containing protein [Spirochaeta africana]AFG36381.1 ABC-type xylose transport system, periplasmic component [Spirochaeta africana DSM 8902]
MCRYNCGCIRAAAVAVLSASLLIAGCSQHRDDEGQRGLADRSDVRIGFSMDSFVVERWQRDRDAFLKAAGSHGAQVLLRTANENVEVQRRQLNELAQSGIDVLVVVPNDSEALSDTIEQIRNRGIPVLAYDRLVRNTPIDGYISFDNQGIGATMAEMVVEAGQEAAAAQKADVAGQNAAARDTPIQLLVINGAVSDYNSYMINRGIVTALRPYIERGQVRLLDNLWLQAWRNEEAREAIEDGFARFDHIDGVVAANDLIADAVVHAAAVRGLAGRLQVSGMDGDLAAVQRVAEGTQLMTIYKPVEELAAQALDTAVQLAHGRELATGELIFNGSVEVPFIKLNPVTVTRDTIMETVIADGFHRWEDVYRNVSPDQRPPSPAE